MRIRDWSSDLYSSYREPALNIADRVPSIGRAALRRFGFVQSSIDTRWGDIVGHTYAEVSAPESIRFPAGQKAGGTLSRVVASGFAPMMQHVLPEIVERVNRFFCYNSVATIGRALCRERVCQFV